MFVGCLAGLSRTGLLLTGMALAMAGWQGTALAQWKPAKPVTIIVPWNSGSPQDQVTRLAAAELEEGLGSKVVIINQPGNQGAVGTKSVIDAAKDGYTWGAGSATDLGTAKVMGMADTKIEDWNVFLTVATTAIVSVNATTPYKDFAELLQAFRDKPGTVRVATAGGNSVGQQTIEIVRKAVPFQYKAVNVDDGKPSIFATVGGEADVVAQMAADQVDALRTRRLRGVAVLSDQPLTIDAYGDVPPLSQFVPGFTYPPNYVGIWVHKSAPAEVAETVNGIWKDKVANSEKLKKYAAVRGAYFTPYFGEEATTRVTASVQTAAYALHDMGKSKTDPAKLGIARPK